MTSTLRGSTLKGEDFCAGSNLWEAHPFTLSCRSDRYRMPCHLTIQENRITSWSPEAFCLPRDVSVIAAVRTLLKLQISSDRVYGRAKPS